MLIGYIIIGLITAIVMLLYLRRAIAQEERELNLYSDDPPEEPTGTKLSAWVIIFAVLIGVAWPVVIVAALLVVITEVK